MKMFTKIAAVATLATFMFAGVNVTWGNSYSDTNGSLGASGQFGVWFDVNDATSIGWENGLKVGLAGPAGMTFRLGYEDVTTLGVGRSWWSSTGNGWATSLNTTLDFTLTNDAGALANDTSDDIAAGAFKVGVNLGFGF
jgi:hypothetical protein